MTPEQLSQQLADVLGDRLPPAWREAYREVPRHLFVPDAAHRAASDDRRATPIDRGTEPQGWLEAVYSEDIIITQHDENGRASSSCAMPEMVFAMLDLLRVEPGRRVLEIGTGTGWNAALLAHRLGDDQVVSVEVDPEVADGARKSLVAAGFNLQVVTGDGADGYPPGGPYDRVIATCTVHRVPYLWVGQTRPGGVIVSPVGTPLDSGAVAQLVVAEDGSASGRFMLGSSFMPLRSQRFEAPDEPDDFPDRADTSELRVDLRDLWNQSPIHAISYLVPACKLGWDKDDDGYIDRVWLLSADSWASAEPGTGVVRQLGPRRLWDEVESAYRWWQEAGSPVYTRFGITVTPERQWVWLDHPDQEIPAPR